MIDFTILSANKITCSLFDGSTKTVTGATIDKDVLAACSHFRDMQ
jgi:hypothetical protein